MWHIDTYLSSRDSTCLNNDYMAMRRLLSSFSVMVSDLWIDGNSTGFDRFLHSWQYVLKSGSSPLSAALQAVVENATFESRVSGYLEQVRNYWSRGNRSAELFIPSPIICFEALFSADSAFAHSIFSEFDPFVAEAFRGLFIATYLLFFVVLAVRSIVRWSQGLKLAHKFMFLSKSLVIEHGQLDLGELYRPGDQFAISCYSPSWKRLRFQVLLVLLAVLVTVVIWVRLELGQRRVLAERQKMRCDFHCIAQTDLTVAWFSFVHLLCRFGQDTAEAAVRSDYYLDVLFRDVSAMDYVTLLAPNYRELLGEFLIENVPATCPDVA
jgi:hypothetical protein